MTEEEIKNQEQLKKKEPPEPPKSLPVSARPITSPMSALSGLSVAELLDQVRGFHANKSKLFKFDF